VACRDRGRRIVNSVNAPTWLSTSIVPPCSWVTMFQLIDKPSPAARVDGPPHALPQRLNAVRFGIKQN